MLTNSNHNERVTFPHLNSKKAVPVCSQLSDPPAYGKGDAIYVQEEDIDFSHDEIDRSVNKQPVKEIAPFIVDRKLTSSLLLNSISPSSLLQNFGDNYIEDETSPRKFIIKVDLNNLPDGCKNTAECSFLFEVADSSSCVVEANISISFLSDKHAQPDNLLEILNCDLDTFCQGGPLTAKSVVDRLVEQLTLEVVLWPKHTGLKKAAPGLAKVPVEFIHDVCGRKPKICGVRDAVRHSVNTTVTKEKNLQLPADRNKDKQPQLCCGICFTEEDTQLGTGEI